MWLSYIWTEAETLKLLTWQSGILLEGVRGQGVGGGVLLWRGRDSLGALVLLVYGGFVLQQSQAQVTAPAPCKTRTQTGESTNAPPACPSVPLQLRYIGQEMGYPFHTRRLLLLIIANDITLLSSYFLTPTSRSQKESESYHTFHCSTESVHGHLTLGGFSHGGG